MSEETPKKVMSLAKFMEEAKKGNIPGVPSLKEFKEAAAGINPHVLFAGSTQIGTGLDADLVKGEISITGGKMRFRLKADIDVDIDIMNVKELDQLTGFVDFSGRFAKALASGHKKASIMATDPDSLIKTCESKKEILEGLLGMIDKRGSNEESNRLRSLSDSASALLEKAKAFRRKSDDVLRSVPGEPEKPIAIFEECNEEPTPEEVPQEDCDSPEEETDPEE